MAKNKWINKKMVKKSIRPSAQNPSSTKYRDQAKSMISTGFVSNYTKSEAIPLTEENLEIFQSIIDKNYKPNLKNLSKEHLDEISINSNLSSKFNEEELKNLKGYKDDIISEAPTFSTSFTNCTNESFSYFLRRFNNSSEIHKEMLTILAAATEIINLKGSNGTDEEYYFVLINSLCTNTSIVSLTSNIILLFYVIKRLPKELIKNKFGEFQKFLKEFLKKHSISNNTTFFRFLIKIYVVFLTNLDENDWELLDTQSTFIDNLLRFVTHSKSKIRKLSRQSNINLLKNFANYEKEHPIFKIILDFSIKKIENTNGEDITDVLHILNLWKEIIIYLPITKLEKLFENILSLLMLGNALIYSNCMQVLENFFIFETNCCTSDLNNKLLLALYNCQPSLNDTQPLLSWSYVMKLGVLNLKKLEKNLFVDHILRLFKIYFLCFEDSNENNKKFITTCINEILNVIVNDNFIIKSEIFLSIGETLNDFLNLKYCSSLKYIFKLIATFFKLSRKECNSTIEMLLDKILFLKNSDSIEIQNYLYDNIYKNLIQHHGIELLLKKLPLEADLTNFTIKNSWVIDVIRNNLKNDKISNFIKYILPVSEKIYKDSKLFKNQNDNINNDNIWVFHHNNLWSLLPVFLNEPIDIQESFKNIAKTLGILLKDAPHIRSFILKSLRQLIIKSIGDDKLEISKYTKNYIPILLNLYLTECSQSKSLKLSIYATLYYFFKITDKELIDSIHTKFLENIKLKINVKKKYLLYDLLRCIICNLKDEEKIIQTFNEGIILIVDNFKRHDQKKGFRLIEELLKSNNYSIIDNYFKNKNENLYDFMFKYFTKNFSSIIILAAQASFIRIIQYLIIEKFKEKKMSIDNFKLHLNLLINVFNSKKSHKLLYSTFAILYTLIDCTENGQIESILFLIDTLNEENISIDKKTTIFFMLNDILKKYNAKIDKETKSKLIENLLKNLDNQNNKIVKVILVFIRDWFKITTREEMLPYINYFIKYLNSINHPESSLIKYKIKNIIEKLLKKYGFDIISRLLDKKYSRLIKNLEKRSRKDKFFNKKEKLNELNESNESNYSDSEIEKDDGKHKIRLSKSRKRWNYNDNEEEDEFKIFDPTKLNKFSNNSLKETNNNYMEIDELKTKNNKSVIRINKEGEIIVSDDENKNDKIEKNQSDSDNEENIKKSKLRKKSNISQNILNKYRKKRGIHRDLKANLQTGKEYRSKRAFGDMKKNNAPEPFAYIPLNKSILSKRKSLKNKNKIKNLITAAFEGVSKDKSISNKKNR